MLNGKFLLAVRSHFFSDPVYYITCVYVILKIDIIWEIWTWYKEIDLMLKSSFLSNFLKQ